MEYKWHILNSDAAATASLKESLRINETICRILTQRGITTFDAAKDYFRPSLQQLHDPFLMKDMDKAVERICNAISNNEKILVFGDYDVDGTTSVASMYQFLEKIYAKEQLDFYIPHRYKEGYGVSKAGIDYAKAKEFSLIIALDCGIKSVELIDYASTLDIDFIICDHHLPGKELPKAAAILNPKQPDCPYPFKELCGCGVGFKLMMALAVRLGLNEDSYLDFLDLVAVAIAADIVPMNGENRILAYHGLAKINQSPSRGIKSIIEFSGVDKQLTINNVVFIIAPRINAAGRMDDAKIAVRLFIEKDEINSKELARQLQEHNTDRKEADSIITLEALELIRNDNAYPKKKSTVVFSENWHKGVVGIVASRLIEHHYRPTIVLTLSDGIITGSARSIRDFNLYEAIYDCKEHLLAFGGHFAAAGLSLKPENLKAFAESFERTVSAQVTEEMMIPKIIIDSEIGLHEITQQFFGILTQMEPFGPENMRPVFIAKNVANTGYSRIVGDKHLKFEVKQNKVRMSGIGFNMASKADIVLSGQPFDMVFTVEENEFNGQVKLQLKVQDCHPSE